MKYLKWVYQKKSTFEIGKVTTCDKWDPNNTDWEERGGFNFTNEECALRWMSRGDTLYEVEIPEDGEMLEVRNDKTPGGIMVSNKIILKNPIPISEELLEEYFLYYSETEKTTPNLEDLQDLLNCRKKMIKFRNSINYSPCNEYENIINCDKIIENIQDETESHHGKKKSIWNKYIKEQINKEKNKNYEHNKRLFSEPFPNVEINFENFNEEDEKEDEKNEENEEDNLFILGVIERAAKERKTIKSAFVK